jgi:hypothetical protein
VKREAETELRKIGIATSVLRDQWVQQVQTQTKPAPRECPLFLLHSWLNRIIGQSTLAGKREVDALLVLEQNLKNSRQNARRLESQVKAETACGSDVAEITLELQEVRASCVEMAEAVRQKRALLGVDQRTALRRIRDSTFLQLKMNARTLKTRLRDRIRQRKFELEPLERSRRHTKSSKTCMFGLPHIDSSSDRDLASNVESAIKRREPGVAKLAKMYNDLCDKMQQCVRQGNAPSNVARPVPINMQSLFSLDVDEEIWQDAGLEDDDHIGTAPLWLEDSKTRNGIKYLLVVDRCLEEELRIRKERTSLQEWMYEEWVTLQEAYNLDSKSVYFSVAMILKASCRHRCRCNLPARCATQGVTWPMSTMAIIAASHTQQ